MSLTFKSLSMMTGYFREQICQKNYGYVTRLLTEKNSGDRGVSTIGLVSLELVFEVYAE